MMIRGSSARCYACGQSQEESCGTCTRVATATALPSRLLSAVLQSSVLALRVFRAFHSTSLERQGDAPEPLQA